MQTGFLRSGLLPRSGMNPFHVLEKPAISHIIIETKSIPAKTYWNSGMAHFAEINQAPSPYSML